MSTELWKNRILSTAEKNKRFAFYNPNTNGLGSWIDFYDIAGSDIGGNKVLQLKFRFEFGDGFVNIADTEGKLREPFFDRTWFYGELTRHGNTCMARFRFVDEPTSGSELGTRVFTHWRHGRWNQLPKQDANGKLINTDDKISFGWSVNGNAYHWEMKPVDSAETPKEAAKVPKSFVPKSNPVAESTVADELKATEAPVKKPKMFIPKSKQSDTPQS